MLSLIFAERQRRWDDLTDSDSSIEQIRGYRGRNIPPHIHFNAGDRRQVHRKSMDEIYNARAQKLRRITQDSTTGGRRPLSSRTSGESSSKKLSSTNNSRIIATIASTPHSAAADTCKDVRSNDSGTPTSGIGTPNSHVSTLLDSTKRSVFHDTIVVGAENIIRTTDSTIKTVISPHPLSTHLTSTASLKAPILDSTGITKVDSVVLLDGKNCDSERTLAV